MKKKCSRCGHLKSAHADYLMKGSMLCWTKKSWVDDIRGYQSCNCWGYRD